MHNKGLHKGLEFIRQTRTVLLDPTIEDLKRLNGDLVSLNEEESWVLTQLNKTFDGAEIKQLEGRLAVLAKRREDLLEERKRKLTFKTVLEHLLNNRVAEANEDRRGISPLMALALVWGMDSSKRPAPENIYA